MARNSKSLVVQDGEPTDVDGHDKTGIDGRYTVSPIRALLPDKGARKKASHEHNPTEKSRRGVLHAVGLGMNHENIAKVMGISVNALRNHYREELDIGLSVVMDDVKTMRPDRLGFMWTSAARAARKVPLRLTASTESHSSGEMFSISVQG